jgi:SAM-dependent MidA family methyltransferase
LRYLILEPFPVLQERQRQTLEVFRDKVDWRESPEPSTGVYFSNELLDAMPVRLIGDRTEKLVGVDGDKFVFVERPVDKTMFNQLTLEWVDDVAANLQRGYVLAVDYGHLGAQFEASIQVRARHRLLDSPFEEIGRADITMHVDWSSVIARAQFNGLRLAGFTDQHHFLTGIISLLGLPDSPKLTRELQTLLHPEMLGRAFQVLTLEKNLAASTPPVAGLKFATESHNVLKVVR